MLLGVESIINSHMTSSKNIKHTSAMFVKMSNPGAKESWKWKQSTDKLKMFCKYCRKKGHMKTSCFELAWYPDWYKDLQKTCTSEKKLESSRHQHDSKVFVASVSEAIQKEFVKMFNTKQEMHYYMILSLHIAHGKCQVKFWVIVQALSFFPSSDNFWIIDIGASNHMFTPLQLSSWTNMSPFLMAP